MIQNEESSYKYDQKIQLFFMYVSDENTSNMLHDTTKARIEIRVSMSSEWSPWIRRRRMPDGKIGEIRSPCFSLLRALPTRRQSQPAMEV